MGGKIVIGEVNKIIKKTGIPYGVNAIFPEEIDTSPCEDYFGKRCPHNIHVTGKKMAHKDRADPRYNWRKHVDEDLKIPHEVLPICIGSGMGAAIGALVDKNRRRGAGIGAILGAIAGAFFEIATKKD